MSDILNASDDLHNKTTDDAATANASRSFLEELKIDQSSSDKAPTTATTEKNYLSYDSMKSRGIDPITDSMNADQLSPAALHEGRWRHDKKAEPMRNAEMETLSEKIAGELIKNPSLHNAEISKILERAADTNQMKTLLQLVNNELAQNGSELKLDSNKQTFVSRVIAEIGPSWLQASDIHSLTLNNNGTAIDSETYIGNQRNNRPDSETMKPTVPTAPRYSNDSVSSQQNNGTRNLPELRLENNSRN